VRPTRDQAWETLTRYTASESLRRHALAVEASVRFYARLYGEDEEFWGCVALLHDFDYEIHPTLDKHPQDGAPILREEGFPEELIEAALSHAEHLEMPRDTQLKKVLFACDELSGFVHACGLVRPTGIDGLEPKSVKKKLKQPSFAAAVNRDEVYRIRTGKNPLPRGTLDALCWKVQEGCAIFKSSVGSPSGTSAPRPCMAWWTTAFSPRRNSRRL